MSAMKIDTLVSDVYRLLSTGNHHALNLEAAKELGISVAGHLENTLAARTGGRELGKIYATDLGKPCTRQLWYQFHSHENREPLPPEASFKFLYGNLIEDIVLFLSAETGHSVTGLQDRIEYQVTGNWKVSGRKDADIDGVLVDVKSATSRSFSKYKGGITADNDPFGYRHQLGFYYHFSEVPYKEPPKILMVDKQMGHIQLVDVDVPTKDELVSRMVQIVEALDHDEPPNRSFVDVPDGKSGNRKLGINCSYCDFKWDCWPDLRGFAYSDGPRYLTVVSKEPKTKEFRNGGASSL